MSENSSSRSAIKLGLELDERFQNLGISSRIIDLQDEDADLGRWAELDILLLVTRNEGQFYSARLHQLLIDNRIEWINKPVGSIVVTEEMILAESTDRQLKNTLKALGVDLIPEKLIVTSVDTKFDDELKLTDSQLNLALYRFLHHVIDHVDFRKSA